MWPSVPHEKMSEVAMRKAKRGEIPSRPFPMPSKPVPVAPVQVTGPVRLLSKQEVLALLPIKSPVSLWSWIRDGRFPAPRVIGKDGGHASRIGWIDAEVYAAIANAPKRLPKGSKEGS